MAQHKNKPASIKTSVPAAPKVVPKAPKAAAPPPDWSALADRYALRAVGVLIFMGLLLRLPNLSALSLWVDEFVHVLRARDVVRGTGPLLTDDNNGILLTGLMLPLFKLFGPGVFWARILSVGFGAGMIWLTYRLGSRLFNRYIGLMAAFMSTFSLFLVFWSRMARNYAIFGFFFLLLSLVFLAAFEKENTRPVDQNDRTGSAPDTFWDRNGLSRKHLLLLPLVFVAALLSHQLTFFFLFSVAVYCLVLAIQKMVKGDADRFKNKYLWAGAALLPLMLVMIPAFGGVFKSVFSGMFLSRIENWVIPRWDFIGQQWATNPFSSFNVYNDLLLYDPRFLYLPGLLGFAAAFRLRPKSALWLLLGFAVPLFLAGFIFRDPAAPRYFIFAFPYFLIAIAAFFYFLWEQIGKRMPNLSNNARYTLAAVPFVLFLFATRWSEIADLTLARVKSGVVAHNNITGFSFTNWQDPCNFVNKNKKPGDLFLSTVPGAVQYYLNDDNIVWFRQKRLNTATKQYEAYPMSDGSKPNASTLEDLMRTVKTHPRGWLLTNYYMDTPFTGNGAREFVFENMQYYPEASPDGSVMLFGWDNAKPKPEFQNLVVELGRLSDKMSAPDEKFVVPEEMYNSGVVFQISVRVRGVDQQNEAALVFNKDARQSFIFPLNKTKDIETHFFDIPRAWLKPGINTYQLAYNPKYKPDPKGGFTVYGVFFRTK
jgi:uncharacterized membrane protein